jgi:hypothetical protein
MPTKDPAARKKRAVRRYFAAVDGILAAADELKAADQALSAESRRPELKVAAEETTTQPTPPEGGPADVA